VNNLPKVVTQLLPRVEFEPVDRNPLAPPRHHILAHVVNIIFSVFEHISSYSLFRYPLLLFII